MHELPERHIECSECKKPVFVVYTEIVGKTMYRLSMCADCPLLAKKLHGTSPPQTHEEAVQTGLACGNCATNADEVKMGAPVGCSLCYEVFDELLNQELSSAERLPPKLKGVKRAAPLHLGRFPGQTAEINPALKLLALHQALHETLGQEDYEQAAWLRDQIKALTEENNDQKPAQ